MFEPTITRCMRCDTRIVTVTVHHCRTCGVGKMCDMCHKNCVASRHEWYYDIALTPQAGDRSLQP